MFQTISAEATGFVHFNNNCICLHSKGTLTPKLLFYALIKYMQKQLLFCLYCNVTF